MSNDGKFYEPMFVQVLDNLNLVVDDCLRSRAHNELPTITHLKECRTVAFKTPRQCGVTNWLVNYCAGRDDCFILFANSHQLGAALTNNPHKQFAACYYPVDGIEKVKYIFVDDFNTASSAKVYSKLIDYLASCKSINPELRIIGIQ